MAIVPTISRLADSLHPGLPPGVAAILAESSGLHSTSVERLVALWLNGRDQAEWAKAIASRRAGCVGIVAPGNLFIATWQLIVEVLALGGTVRVRTSSRDLAAVRVFQDLLESVQSPWRAAIEVCHFARDDEAEWRRFAAGLDAVIAQGSDATMDALGKRLHRLRPTLPVRRHGHRLSWMWASRADGETAIISEVAAIAQDTLLADGRGCMAPRALLVEGGVDNTQTLADALEAALASHAKKLPVGRLPETLAATQRAWLEQARFDAALLGSPFHATMSDGFGLAVIGGPPPPVLHARDLGPGGRFLVVRSAPEGIEGLATLAAHTSTVGLCGFSKELGADASNPIVTALAGLGVRRICALGRMQAPPWSQTSDGGVLGAEISLPVSASS